VARFIAHGFGDHSPEPRKSRDARTLRLKAGAFCPETACCRAQCAERSPHRKQFPKLARVRARQAPKRRELDCSIQHRPAWNGRDALKCLAFQRVRVL